MTLLYQGKPVASDGRFAIIVARFNPSITSRLVEGAVATLTGHGVADEQIDVVWVPGAFELPTVAERCASAQYVAVICLGAVIRGQTSHDQHINRAVSLTLAEMGVRHRMPVIFGVLTCETLEQAIARSGGQTGAKGKESDDTRLGNKGVEAAEAALEMVDLMRQLPRP